MYCLLIIAVSFLDGFVLGREAVYANPSLVRNFGGCALQLPQNPSYAPTITNEKTDEVYTIQKAPGRPSLIHLNKGEEVKANCGRGNTISIHESFYYIRFTCVGGNQFMDDANDILDLSENIQCAKPRTIAPVIRRNGTCSGKNTNFNVDFPNEYPPRTFYSVCVDERVSATLYSSSYLDGKGLASEMAESGGNRPQFRGQEFYPFSIKEAYKWDNAYDRLAYLLGSEDLVQEYFPKQQFRFSKGHLFPNADGVRRYEKHATFYYINTVPQWQNLNGGNWAKIEQDVRDLAKSRGRTLNVITGAYGVATLLDVNNNPTEIWLAEDENRQPRLPVPRFVWKVVHDPATNEAIAIVQINNPHEVRPPPASDLLCEDKCHNLGWIRSDDFHNPGKGYSYCCDVNELRGKIPYIPYVKYTQLLGEGTYYNPDNGDNDDSGIESGDDYDSSDESSYSDSASRESQGYRTGFQRPSMQRPVDKIADMFASISLGKNGAPGS